MLIRFTLACMLMVGARLALDEPALGGAADAAQITCFTCDLDPSVHACSSIASNAQHRCNRACFECVEFNGVEECFFGLCSPD